MTLIQEAVNEDSFISCVFSNPRKKDGYHKIVIKPVIIKESYLLQLAKTDGQKEFHENISPDTMTEVLLPFFEVFKQVQLFTSQADYQCLINKKSKLYIKKQAPTKKIGRAHV